MAGNAMAASRRGLLAGVGGAILAGAAAPGAQDGAGADAELIELCGRFDALQRNVFSFYDGGANAIEDDEARNETQKPLVAAQMALLERIFELRAVTPAGFMARARTIWLWEEGADGLLAPENLEWPSQKMMAALVRDMVALAEARA